jgi:hypothetical protein
VVSVPRDARGGYGARNRTVRRLRRRRWLSGVVALWRVLLDVHRLPMPENIASSWLAPVSFFSIFAGLFLIVSRKRAVNQVLGFLVLENGIYTFGVGVAPDAFPGRSRRAAGRVRGGVRHGHHHLPHQPRVRPHQHRPLEHVEGLMRFMIYDLRFTIARAVREFSGSAGILPAGSRVAGPPHAARCRRSLRAIFSISHSK